MIIFNKKKTYEFDPARNLGFSKFNKQCSNFIFIEGFSDFDEIYKLNNNKIVYLELEEPNRFFVEDPRFNHIEHEDKFDRIFTICPFTASWLNKKYGNTKRTAVFFPFDEDLIPKYEIHKKSDIIYTGNINSKEIDRSLSTISKYNYKFVTSKHHELATDINVDYLKKIQLISESKISLVHNLLFLKPKHLNALKKTSADFKDNHAYNLVPTSLLGKLLMILRKKEILAPQIKSRVFEAAFCHSLILCRRDPFNLIEKFFVPEKEFVYYDPDKLDEKINDILNNYNNYIPVIENAYKRAINEYTTRSFVKKYLISL